MDRPEGGTLDGRRAWPESGRSAAGLGSPQGDWLDDPDAPALSSRRGHTRGARGVQKKLEQAVAEESAKHPDKPIEVFATDEHRIGLKPIPRRVWAPQGQRPLALGHHGYEWLSGTAFVQPASGEVFWSLSNGVSKPFFEGLLALFAREVGAGRERIVVLLLDGAGWHTEPGLAVPDGLRLVYLPRYSPELQPAERLWRLIDEPLVNRHFASLAELDATVAQRCLILEADRDTLKAHTGFHWWPKPIKPS